MRIAIIADPIDNQQAGVHVYTREMIKALLAQDKMNEYILIRQKRDQQFGAVKQLIVPSISLPIGFASFRLFFIIPLLCIWHRVDAVIEPAHFGPFNLPRRIKRITVIHDLTPLLMPTLHRWHSQLLQRWFLPAILRRAALIVTNSQHTAADVHRLFPFAVTKTIVCYPGVEERFKPTIDPHILAQYGIKQPYFLYVGTIEPRKNLAALVLAFDEFMSRSQRPYTLVIAGAKGWKYKAFFKVLSTLQHSDKVSVIGYVDDASLPALYSMCEAFFYVSQYEGFGFPVAEAMACGVLSVVSNNSSLPEVGGDAVHYWNTTDTNDLASLMQTITNHTLDLDSIKTKSIAQAKQFSWAAYGRLLSERINGL